MDELRRVLHSEAYNRLLKHRLAVIKPVEAKTLYTISCGRKGIIEPDTSPMGAIFIDGSFLRIFEKWTVKDDRLLEYSYHYQVPHGISIRYEKDSESASASHPEHHLQTSSVGDDIRLPTGEVRCEEVLRMIFEQFVTPKQIK